ncbi:MAG: hypothetical protein ACLFV0_07655, partial [Nitriliruptoraceae bacterium]
MRVRTALLLVPLFLLAACGGGSDPEVLEDAESTTDASEDEGEEDASNAEEADAEEAATEDTADAEEAAEEDDTAEEAADESDDPTGDEPALPVTMVDADGNEVTVEDTSRIVSLTGT